MKKLLLFSFVLLMKAGLSQFPNVLISTLREPEEVCIAINPNNTNQVVAGSNLANRFRSSDGGLTWAADVLTCLAYDVWGDPVLIWDTADVCYYLHLSNPNPAITPGGTWVDRIVTQGSADFGNSYNNCSAVGKNGSKAQDKPWAVVNPANNELHVTWTQFDNYGSSAPSDSSIILHSRSSDGGATWASPTRISFYAGNCIDSDSTVEGAVPAIGPGGEVYAAWAGPRGLVFQRSLDGGSTWMAQEKILGPIPGGWDYTIDGLIRANGLPFTFCDLSNGPNRGTIYINWSDQRNGPNDGDIWIIRSADGGVSWTAPVRVNDDVPGKQQFMSAMTIDQATGYVYVVFYDRRNFASSTSTDVYLAVSKDGAATFTNYKINATTFAPSAGVFFGDYISVSAHNNVVRPMWMQLHGGRLSVYTAIFEPPTVGIYESRLPALKNISASPNPFKQQTRVSFSLVKNVTLEIQLVDAEGKIVKTLLRERKFSAGEHDILVDAAALQLKSGIYFLVFYHDDKSSYIKLISE